MAFLSSSQVESIGFQYVGANVRISERAVFYNPSLICIGDHCRIDDFCILSAGEGGIELGRYVHIGCYSSLIGSASIVFGDLSGTSGRVSIYSSSEDFSGMAVPLPTVPATYRDPKIGPVQICRHAAIGAGSVILPNVTVGVGAVVGALCVVHNDLAPFGIYSGSPLKRISYRLKGVLDIERTLLGDDCEP